METPLTRKLEAALEVLPKEGLKAAIAGGVLERVREMVEEAYTDVKLAECVASGRGSIKDNIVDPKCGGIRLVKHGDEAFIGKVGSNAIGVRTAGDSVEFKISDIKLIVNSEGLIEIEYLGGYRDRINYTDLNILYKYNYNIKYAIRKIGKRFSVIKNDLQACARQNALVC